MAPSGLFFLPQPFPPNSLSLGQLLPNPLDPSSGPFFSASSLSAQDLREPHIQARYKDLVSFDEEGRLAASLSGRKVDPSRKDLLLLLADEMEYRGLRNPNSAFDAICQDPAAVNYLRDRAAHKQPLYFVVGIQQLKNATYRSAVIEQGPLGISVAEAPESELSLPIHVRRDSTMDISDSSATGVFGFEVRKVQCRLGRADEPHLLEDLDLSWNYHRSSEDDSQLSVGMSKELQAEELRNLVAAMGDSSDSYDASDSE